MSEGKRYTTVESAGATFTGGTVTAPILFPDGTAAAPSIAFSGEAGNDTGWYLIAADNIGFTSAGLLRWQNRGDGIVVSAGIGAGLWCGDFLDLGSVADTRLTRTAANVMAPAAGDWFQNAAGRVRLVSNVTNNTTTFANLTELSVTLIAGRKYSFKLVLFVENSTASDGASFDLNGGTATITSLRCHGFIIQNSLDVILGSNQRTTLAGIFGSGTITGASILTIEGAMVVNAGGTFIPRQAMATAVSGTLTTYLNSFMLVEDMPA